MTDLSCYTSESHLHLHYTCNQHLTSLYRNPWPLRAQLMWITGKNLRIIPLYIVYTPLQNLLSFSLHSSHVQVVHVCETSAYVKRKNSTLMGDNPVGGENIVEVEVRMELTTTHSGLQTSTHGSVRQSGHVHKRTEINTMPILAKGRQL